MAVLWQFPEDESTSAPMLRPPVLAGDVLICSTSRSLRGIDLYDGTTRWNHDLTNALSGPVSVSGNRVFLLGDPVEFGSASDGSGGDDTVVGDDDVVVDDEVNADDTVVDDGDVVVDDGDIDIDEARVGLVVLDVGTGKPCHEWAAFAHKYGHNDKLTVASGVLILFDTDGHLCGYDARSGSDPDPDDPLWRIHASVGDETPGPTAVGDKAVFFVIGDELIGVNVRSGQTRWRFSPGDDQLPQDVAPFVGKGLAVVMGEKAVHAIDWRSGERKWEIPNPAGQTFNSPVISWQGDTLFFTTRQGQAYGHVLGTGEQIWHSDLHTLAAQANAAAQSGGFFPPTINDDVVPTDHESGHLETDHDVLLPAESGMVFAINVKVINSIAGKSTYTVADRIEAIKAPDIACTPVTANGMLITTAGNGTVTATRFSDETAVYIGRDARITIPQAYDFGCEDFSLEAWIRTTTGGDLITQSPSPNGNGFRVTIVNQPGVLAKKYGEARVQFTIGDKHGQVPLFAQTLPTRVADGHWHHLAVVRAGNRISILVDSVSQPLRLLIHRSLVGQHEQSQLPPTQNYFPFDTYSEHATVPMVGNSREPLVVGEYVPTRNDPKNFTDRDAKKYVGMVADVRIWNLAVTANQVRNRMSRLLTGADPGLVRYLPLNQTTPGDLKEATTNALLGSNARNVTCKTTNLALNKDLFPYLVHAAEATWPYKERWTARAPNALKWTPAGAGEVVCFVTSLALYAVDATHGTRKWSWDITRPSPPAADGDLCYVLDDQNLTAFDIETGVRRWTTPIPGTRSVDLAPALTTGCVVCSTDGKTVHWLDKRTGHVLGHYGAVSGVKSELVANDDRLYLIADGKVAVFVDPPASDSPQVMSPAESKAVDQRGTPQLCVDGGGLFVYAGDQVAALDSETLRPVNGWNPPSLAGRVVTGMAARGDTNTLVLSTGDGHVLFWEYGSGYQWKDHDDLNSATVFAPVIHGSNVYCTAVDSGATGKGSVRAFDLATGDKRAVDKVSAAPVGAPYVAVHTVFFGAGDAIHSAVFGETLALLCEEGDADQAITVSGVDRVFAAAPAEEHDQTNAFQDGDFTLEAWINSQNHKGGQILSLPPGESVAGFELSVDEQGVITAAHLKTGAANRFHSKSTAATDGRWHHIAAVFRHNDDYDEQARKIGQLCYLYLDGQKLTGVVRPRAGRVPPAVSDRQVTIGGSGTSEFHGLIDEVRVWGTWLHAAEVSARRNIKLRGNEASLLASWSFHAKGVKDASVNKLDQENAEGRESLKIRLADLNFVVPNYPYLLTTREAEFHDETAREGGGATKTTLVGKTTISARKADGSPRGNTRIKVWSSTATRIAPDGHPGDAVEVTKDAPADFTLDSDGKLRLKLISDAAHSPVLWLRADYMYENERFFVSPAVESQKHVVTPPPYLSAQSEFIQDYAYTPGDNSLGTRDSSGAITVHEHADITTIHTTITAMTSAGDPLAQESLEIWADGHLTVEIDNQSYELNTENSVKLKTDADGTLTIVTHEDGHVAGNLLDCPTLSVRAGFMPRNSRFVIAPAENANKTLSTVTDKQIDGTEPLAKGETKKRLIKAQFDQKAPAVASTLNQIASLARTHAHKTGLTTAGSAPGSAAPRSGAETANAALFPPDRVESVHHSAHLPYRAPMTPEYMPDKHLVISLTDGVWKAQAFNTTSELDAHVARLNLGVSTSAQLSASVAGTGSDDPVGGWFSDWAEDISRGVHAIEHGVEDAWNDATHFVIKTWDEIKDDVDAIVHQVEVIVADTAKAIGSWVISTVKDVVSHVVEFLKKIATALKDLYNFLKSLFDWKGIVEVHNVLYDMFKQNMEGMKYEVENTLAGEIDGWFTGLKENIAHALGVAGDQSQLAGSFNSQRNAPGNSTSTTVVSNSKGTKSKWMSGKMKSHATSKHRGVSVGSTSTFAMPFGDGLFTPASTSHLNDDFKKMVADIQAVLDQPGGITHLTAKEALGILSDLLMLIVDLAEELLLKLLNAIGDFIQAIIDVFTSELNIPFISELYELITGNRLGILEVLCLIAAIPVHTALVIVGVEWDKDEVGAFFDSRRTFGTVSPPPHAAGSAASTGLKFADVGYVGFSVIGGAMSAVSDLLQGEANLADPEKGWGKVKEPTLGHNLPDLMSPGLPEEPLSNMILGTAANFAGFYSGLFRWIVRSEEEPGAWDKAGTYISMISFVIPLGVGVAAIRGRKAGRVTQGFGRLPGGIPVALVVSLLGLVSTALAARTLTHISEENTSGQRGEAINDLLSAIKGFFAFLNWYPVCSLTNVGGIPVSSAGLALMDVAIDSVAVPVVHLTEGYGKEIF